MCNLQPWNLRGCVTKFMKRMLRRNWDDTIRSVLIKHMYRPTQVKSLKLRAPKGRLRKPYRMLMSSVGPRMWNGRRKGTEDSMRGQQKLKFSKTSLMNSHSGAIGFAAQRGLRWNLTPAGIALIQPARSGASRTQAPSRPRRLHKIQADAFHGSPMGA